jgi:hypothetical protein
MTVDPTDEPDSEEPEPFYPDTFPVPAEQLAQITTQVIANVQQNNLNVAPSVHLPVEDLERLLALADGGRAYTLALARIERQHESDIYLNEAAYRLPYELARRSRPYAITALLIIGALAAYMAHLGSTGKALGILLGVFVPLTVAFLGNNTRPNEPDDPSA